MVDDTETKINDCRDRISLMGKYAISRSQLEALCVGAITNRVAPARTASVAPYNRANPDGNWELINLDPLPMKDGIDETIQVIRDLQAVFSLKPGN